MAALNTIPGTAFFLPCHSGSIVSYWNLQFGLVGQNLVS